MPSGPSKSSQSSHIPLPPRRLFWVRDYIGVIYIGIMEKKTETTILGLGFSLIKAIPSLQVLNESDPTVGVPTFC